MTILEMQQAIQAEGWQWVERVFNDGTAFVGSNDNCMISLTKDKSPTALIFKDGVKPPADLIGWGRFPRAYCWHEAYRVIVEKRQ